MGNYIRKTVKKTPVADTNWKEDEDNILLNNYNKLRASGVAKLVNRTPGACRARLYHLKLKNHEYIKKIEVIYHKWTEEEDQFLKDNYPDQGAVWCAKKLNRTKKSCVHRAGFLNIQRSYRWKPEEDEVIRKYYPKYGVKKVSEILGRNRETCSTRAYVLGVRYINTSIWTEEELKFIKKHYPTKGAKYVASALNKTETACKSKVAILGLKRAPLWTEEQKEFLKKHYPTKGAVWVGKKLNKNPSYCRSMARRNGIKFINTSLWDEEQISILKKYYPIIGKYVYELIPGKNSDACVRAANKLGIAYKKRDSSTVEQIKKYLTREKVIYKQEVGFSECVDKKMLLFDFALYKDKNLTELIGLIEYDGSQHFFSTSLYSDANISANDVLKRTQRHDRLKNEFCQKNKIPMLRIKYNQENIEELVMIFLKNPKSFIKWYNPEFSYREYYADLEDEILKKHYFHFSKYQKERKRINRQPEFCINKWTIEDDLFLEKYYPDKGSKWVAVHLHRTPSGCINRARHLGLYRSNRWTKKDDAFILKYYVSKGPKWIAKELNRSLSSIMHRANRIGAERLVQKWKKTEDDYLIKYYGIKSVEDISNAVNRSCDSIKNRYRILRQRRADECYKNNCNTINVITVQEPFASFIKENDESMIIMRLKTNYRGELYIHTSQRRIGAKKRELYKEQLDLLKDKNIMYNYIVAKCNIVDCIKIDEKVIQTLKNSKDVYGELKLGKYIWVLKNVKALKKSILAKGKTSIWKYEINNNKKSTLIS